MASGWRWVPESDAKAGPWDGDVLARVDQYSTWGPKLRVTFPRLEVEILPVAWFSLILASRARELFDQAPLLWGYPNIFGERSYIHIYYNIYIIDL